MATPSECGPPAAERPAYEPPALLVLGSVDELTLGAQGSVMDQSGRAAHGHVKP
jgi:hypothetical protein